jgi:hypothetical protein
MPLHPTGKSLKKALIENISSLHLWTGPEWREYWHGLSVLQNRTKLWRWDGPINIILNWSSVRLNIPARKAINSFSLKFDLERWQFDTHIFLTIK